MKYEFGDPAGTIITEDDLVRAGIFASQLGLRFISSEGQSRWFPLDALTQGSGGALRGRLLLDLPPPVTLTITGAPAETAPPAIYPADTALAFLSLPAANSLCEVEFVSTDAPIAELLIARPEKPTARVPYPEGEAWKASLPTGSYACRARASNDAVAFGRLDIATPGSHVKTLSFSGARALSGFAALPEGADQGFVQPLMVDAPPQLQLPPVAVHPDGSFTINVVPTEPFKMNFITIKSVTDGAEVTASHHSPEPLQDNAGSVLEQGATKHSLNLRLRGASAFLLEAKGSDGRTLYSWRVAPSTTLKSAAKPGEITISPFREWQGVSGPSQQEAVTIDATNLTVVDLDFTPQDA